MTQGIDLRRLADASGPDRTFISLYLNPSSTWRQLERTLAEYRDLLDAGGDERNAFDRTVAMIRDRLGEKTPKRGSVAVFACWLSDFYEAHELVVEIPERVILDSSPYVRPLAEYLDEWETFCIVTLDHRVAGIYLVAGADISQVDKARGDIKNHVRKGGWSQQRYERRRDKQILHYCREISERLESLYREERFDRLLIAGDRTLIKELQGHLSPAMTARVAAAEPLQAGLSERELFQALAPAFVSGERAAEHSLFESIREERFHGGRSATGASDTLEALEHGRVDQLLVDRQLEHAGRRCRSCEHLMQGAPAQCTACDGEVFEVDLVNEMVELATKTGARVEFADPMEGLTLWGGVAALLRY